MNNERGINMGRKIKEFKYKICNKENYAILFIPYKEIFKEVYIDLDKLDKVLNKKIYCTNNNSCIIRLEDSTVNLKQYLFDKSSKLYSKTANIYDFRKSNLTEKKNEAYNYDEMRLKISIGNKNMSKESRQNIIKGCRYNRYCKDYSLKMQNPQIGENNTMAILSWEDVNYIRGIYKQEGISQQTLADEYGIARTTINDIVNYRTWTIKKELNERIFKDNPSIDINKKEYDLNKFVFSDTIPNMLFVFEDKQIYIERLSIEDLFYIEERTIEGKLISSLDIYIPKEKKKGMKDFYLISKINPASKKRAYYHRLIREIF